MVEADPTQEQREEGEVEVVATTFKGENLYAKWTPEEREARKNELLQKSTEYEPFTERSGEFRHPEASSSGGFELRDAAQTSLLRSAVGEIISVSTYSQSYNPSITSSQLKSLGLRMTDFRGCALID